MILDQVLANVLYLSGLAIGLTLAIAGSLILTRGALHAAESRADLGTSVIMAAPIVLILGLIAAALSGPAWWHSRYGVESAPLAGVCTLLLLAAIHRHAQQKESERRIGLILAWLAVVTGALSVAVASLGA